MKPNIPQYRPPHAPVGVSAASSLIRPAVDRPSVGADRNFERRTAIVE